MIKYVYFLVVLFLCALIASNLHQINRLAHSISSYFPIVEHQGKKLSNVKSIRLRAVGDVMLGRHVGVVSHRKNDWTWAFQASLPNLPPTDFLVGNLEFPIVQNCPYRSDGMVFCAPPESVAGLTYAGFNLVGLANNHSGNYGAEGMTNTINTLTQNNINSLTEYQSKIVTIKGVTVGFLALHDLYQPIDASKTAEIIRDLKSKTAAVVVLPHWGIEYEHLPSARQKHLAQIMLGAGASVILGAHPHVLQPIESTNTTLIAYSLGNFVFDQMWSEDTRKGTILDIDLEFTNASLSAIKYQNHFTTIYDYGQPRLD